MIENVYLSYSTNPGFLIVTFYGVVLIISGIFDIKSLIEILTWWKLWIYEMPHNLKRLMMIASGILLVIAMFLTAAN